MKLFETKFTEDDLTSINEVLKNGDLGFGFNVDVLEKEFEQFSSAKYNVSTNSASAAAFILYAFLKEKYGICDVYTTSLGFTSPIWAAKHFGHNIIFVDVDNQLNFCSLSYRTLRQNNQRKIVVMPVLYGGVSNILNFNLIGDEIVIIDSAHCVTPKIKYDYAFFSFHPYKPICASDGGMISTNDGDANTYIRAYKNFGRQSVGNTYTINQEGFKFYMNNLNATLALTQIKKYYDNLKIRQSNYQKLQEQYILLPHDSDSSFYFATTLLDDADDMIRKHQIARHYPMLHQTPYYNNGQRLPNLESLHSKILNLPLWTTFVP